MDDEKTLQQRALNLSYRYLKVRPRTVHEIKTYLVEKARKKPKKYSFNEKIIHKVVEELTEFQLLDDRKFVEWFVRYRATIKPKGTYALRQELKRFGVDQTIVESYFDTNPIDEEVVAQELLQKRYARYRHLPRLEAFKKMHDFLRRRGFPYEAVKKAIAKVQER